MSNHVIGDLDSVWNYVSRITDACPSVSTSTFTSGSPTSSNSFGHASAQLHPKSKMSDVASSALAKAVEHASQLVSDPVSCLDVTANSFFDLHRDDPCRDVAATDLLRAIYAAEYATSSRLSRCSKASATPPDATKFASTERICPTPERSDVNDVHCVALETPLPEALTSATSAAATRTYDDVPVVAVVLADPAIVSDPHPHPPSQQSQLSPILTQDELPGDSGEEDIDGNFVVPIPFVRQSQDLVSGLTETAAAVCVVDAERRTAPASPSTTGDNASPSLSAESSPPSPSSGGETFGLFTAVPLTYVPTAVYITADMLSCNQKIVLPPNVPPQSPAPRPMPPRSPLSISTPRAAKHVHPPGGAQPYAAPQFRRSPYLRQLEDAISRASPAPRGQLHKPSSPSHPPRPPSQRSSAARKCLNAKRPANRPSQSAPRQRKASPASIETTSGYAHIVHLTCGDGDLHAVVF